MTGLNFVNDKGQIEPPMACLRCGICCTDHQVSISTVEGQGIANRLGLAWKEFLNEYADMRWPGTKSFLLRKHNGACIFLERIDGSKATRCRIHDFKPSSCIDWLPGLYRRECQKGIISRFEGFVCEDTKTANR